jgi:hypothetical protein
MDVIQAAEDKPELAQPLALAAEEEAIGRVLRESQTYESLLVYQNPDNFNPGEMENLFVPASLGGRSAQSIEAAVKRQLERGYRYGPDSRLEVFDILFVRVYPPGDYAEAQTRERWYLPVILEDGTRVVERNPFLGRTKLPIPCERSMAAGWCSRPLRLTRGKILRQAYLNHAVMVGLPDVRGGEPVFAP